MATIIVDGQVTAPTGYKVQPQSYRSLEDMAGGLLKLLNIAGAVCEDKIDCVAVLEKILPKSGYDYHIAEDADMQNSAAFTIPDMGLVVLSRTTYEGLFLDNVFSRSTVIHELAHIVLKHHLTLHRGSPIGEHKHCEDSEWQAKALTAAVMMPVKVVKEVRADPQLLAEVCGTSVMSASYRVQNLERFGIYKIELNEK